MGAEAAARGAREARTRAMGAFEPASTTRGTSTDEGQDPAEAPASSISTASTASTAEAHDPAQTRLEAYGYQASAVPAKHSLPPTPWSTLPLSLYRGQFGPGWTSSGTGMDWSKSPSIKEERQRGPGGGAVALKHYYLVCTPNLPSPGPLSPSLFIGANLDQGLSVQECTCPTQLKRPITQSVQMFAFAHASPAALRACETVRIRGTCGLAAPGTAGWHGAATVPRWIARCARAAAWRAQMALVSVSM